MACISISKLVIENSLEFVFGKDQLKRNYRCFFSFGSGSLNHVSKLIYICYIWIFNQFNYEKTTISLRILISSLAFSQSKERISLHLFDLPSGITIEEFQNDLDKANNIYEKNGFGVNKYKVYQVNSDDEAKNSYFKIYVSR